MIKGEKHGYLTAIKFIRKVRGNQYWLFRCDCGSRKRIRSDNVLNGITRSCGCYRKINNKNLFSTHGMTDSSTYRTWNSMRMRCGNKKDPSYKNYGGRGITVCKRWDKFENFYEDMGERPEETTLDRIDNGGEYKKENCRWATVRQQHNNTRVNHFISHEGKTKTIAQWARVAKISYNTLWYRVNCGWSVEKALTK